MKTTIRKMNVSDIGFKIKWINDCENNRFLHYELPLEYEKTLEWFEKIKNLENRFDGIIEYDKIPIGLIGLLNITKDEAEFYITIGNRNYLGKGIAKESSIQLMYKAFIELNLNRLYLVTEIENIKAQKLFEKIGFIQTGKDSKKVFNQTIGEYVERYRYEITKEMFFNLHLFQTTPIHFVTKKNNSIFIKREDFIPFSFGGNKARKAELFFKEIIEENYDYVVTYGSSSSNHCRIVANKSASLKIPCLIISTKENNHETINTQMMRMFGAKIKEVKIELVRETIEKTLNELREKGFKPYFIQGGGHGNIGTQAYVNTYEEIRNFEIQNNIYFDYVFHSSGTGTTQAGLICGQLIHKDERKIVGISIARRNPYGRKVVLESVRDYCLEKNIVVDKKLIEKNTIFIDDYVGEGYGLSNTEINKLINEMMINYGIPLDHTYTGKGFYGMIEYLKENQIKGKNILFIHTGGTPLFFNDLNGGKE